MLFYLLLIIIQRHLFILIGDISSDCNSQQNSFKPAEIITPETVTFLSSLPPLFFVYCTPSHRSVSAFSLFAAIATWLDPKHDVRSGRSSRRPLPMQSIQLVPRLFRLVLVIVLVVRNSGNCCVRPPTTQWLAYWAGKLLIVRPDFVRSALLLRKQLIKLSCYQLL